MVFNVTKHDFIHAHKAKLSLSKLITPEHALVGQLVLRYSVILDKPFSRRIMCSA